MGERETVGSHSVRGDTEQCIGEMELVGRGGRVVVVGVEKIRPRSCPSRARVPPGDVVPLVRRLAAASTVRSECDREQETQRGEAQRERERERARGR